VRDDQDDGNGDQQIERSHDTGCRQRHSLGAGTNKVNPSHTQRPFTRSESRSMFLSI